MIERIFFRFDVITMEFLEHNYSISMGQSCTACQKQNLSLEQIVVEEDPNHPTAAFAPAKPSSKQSQPTPPQECQQLNKHQTKKSISIMNSKINQSRNYLKFGAGGIKLSAMPDWDTQIVAAKKKSLGEFTYARESLQITDAISLPPIEFEKKYVYYGQWKNNQRNGRGVQQWRDGSIYEGYWKDNLAFGHGRLIHADGDVYVGEWAYDRASGKGIYYSACGAKYEGEWKDDKQDGKGQQIWPDEAVYRGEYKSGKKHGKGHFLWEDDSNYEGQFSENNIQGFGKYCWKDGRVYAGEWKNNKMQGKGVFTWLDGRKYEGEYRNDKKEGFGVFTFKDGRMYQGEWLGGVQHGKGLFKKKNVTREGLWEKGQRVRWCDQKENEDPGISNVD